MIHIVAICCGFSLGAGVQQYRKNNQAHFLRLMVTALIAFTAIHNASSEELTLPYGNLWLLAIGGAGAWAGWAVYAEAWDGSRKRFNTYLLVLNIFFGIPATLLVLFSRILQD
jgi:hypothetical protein